MITPNVGGMWVGHHHGRKVGVLPGQQVLGWAGDFGLAMRFRAFTEEHAAAIPGNPHPLSHGLALSQDYTNSCKNTNAGALDTLNAVLAYPHGGTHQCCIFDGNMQPRLMDEDHYYWALGSGKLSADPFLRFLVDIFCKDRRPNVREAIFLATWTVQHAIETTGGGVAPPIRVAVLENAGGVLVARELPETEIDEHLQAKSSAEEALRVWLNEIQSGVAAENAAPVPTPAEQPVAPVVAGPAGEHQ